MSSINLSVDKAFYGVISSQNVVEAIEMNYEDALSKCEYFNSVSYKGDTYTVCSLALDGSLILNRI